MTKLIVLKDKRTKEELHPRTEVAQVEGLEQYVSEHAMSSEDKEKLEDLPTPAELETAMDGKVDKVDGKGLSTNDFSNYYKNTITSVDGRLADVEIAIGDLTGEFYQN